MDTSSGGLQQRQTEVDGLRFAELSSCGGAAVNTLESAFRLSVMTSIRAQRKVRPHVRPRDATPAVDGMSATEERRRVASGVAATVERCIVSRCREAAR
jgi:hypothetical protein